MTTFTLDHNFISSDLLFVAASDSACADLLASSHMDRPMPVCTGKSFFETLRHMFLGK